MITKIFCIENKSYYDVDIKRQQGENLLVCPVCSQDRKKKHDKSFSFNIEKGIGHCCHCNASFTLNMEREYVKRDYKLPVERTMQMSDKMIAWFKGRGISKETLDSLYITESIEFIPQIEKKRNVICFNFYRQDKLINIKFRDAEKHFMLCKDAELIFYNLNSIINQPQAIICEGEIDCASFLEVDLKHTVSVPNGANKNSVNLDYVDNCFDILENIGTFYIATDNDDAGNNLAKELIRRFGAEKCKRIDFSVYEKCKDANDVLSKFGKEALLKCYNEAKEIPIKGIFDIDSDKEAIYDLWENGMPSGLKLSHSTLNDLVSWVSPAIAIISGIPSHGKSEAVDEICTQLNILHGWKTGYYSPENFPIRLHVSKLVSRISGKKFSKWDIKKDELDATISYVEENFFFVAPENEDYTLDNILDHARILVKKKGIKIFVIDPYNKIDHQYETGESETKYISRILDKLDTFSKTHDVLIILVAHPVKMQLEKNGVEYVVPKLYDIAGSAHFYNKCFYGIVIYKRGDVVEWHIQKVKFKHLGHSGMVNFGYHWESGRYFEASPNFVDSTHCDTTSYLNIKPQQIEEQTIEEKPIEPNKEFEHSVPEKEIIPPF